MLGTGSARIGRRRRRRICASRDRRSRSRASWRRSRIPPSPTPPRHSGSPLSPPSWRAPARSDRKSTRLNSSHVEISYAVFCLKKKKKKKKEKTQKKKKKKKKKKKTKKKKK